MNDCESQLRHIALVIPTFRNPRVLQRLIRSISEHVTRHTLYTIVINNGDDAATRSRLEEWQRCGANRFALHPRENLGYGQGVNHGVAFIQREVGNTQIALDILVLNDDVELLSFCIDNLADVLETNEAAGIVGGKLFYPDGRIQHAGAFINPEWWGNHYGYRQRPIDFCDTPTPHRMENHEFVTGALLLIRSTALNCVRGFDPIYGVGYYEDADLCFRMRKAGWEVVYTPHAQAIHCESMTTKVMGDSRNDLLRRNRLTFKAKHAITKGEVEIPLRTSPEGLRIVVVYRISDNSSKRERIATKEQCLANFLSAWCEAGQYGADKVLILMDTLSAETQTMVSRVITPWLSVGTDIQTFQINAGSSEEAFRRALKEATRLSIPDDVYVYLVEDDYLHRAGSRSVLLEGLAKADYVTLYDHPDKYTQGFVAPAMLFLTRSVHWRTVGSTTGTFAAAVGTLRKDSATWWFYTNGQHGRAWDHAAFSWLLQKDGRTVISPVPGFSTHADKAWLAPIFAWRELLQESNTRLTCARGGA
jgi:GT2 family glycosyltransferase